MQNHASLVTSYMIFFPYHEWQNYESNLNLLLHDRLFKNSRRFYYY